MGRQGARSKELLQTAAVRRPHDICNKGVSVRREPAELLTGSHRTQLKLEAALRPEVFYTAWTGELLDSALLRFRFCSPIIKFHQFMNRNLVDTIGVCISKAMFGPGFLSPSQSCPLRVGGVRFLPSPVTGDTCSSPPAGRCTPMHLCKICCFLKSLFLRSGDQSVFPSLKLDIKQGFVWEGPRRGTNGSQTSLSIKSFQMKTVCFFQ